MKKNHLKIIIFVVVLVLSALACTIPGLNSLPKDDFSNSASGWGTGTDASSSVEYANDGLQLIVYETFYVTWSTPNDTVYENVHVEASVKNEGTDPEALFGIVCNELSTSNSFYYVGVSPNGYYAFIKAADGLDDVYLKEGNSDVVSASSSSMRIGLDCGNGILALYVNGQQIDSVSDATYPSGVVGLFAASDDQESGTSVIFDDFVMTKLGE
jgi:hypothetical protein